MRWQINTLDAPAVHLFTPALIPLSSRCPLVACSFAFSLSRALLLCVCLYLNRGADREYPSVPHHHASVYQLFTSHFTQRYISRQGSAFSDLSCSQPSVAAALEASSNSNLGDLEQAKARLAPQVSPLPIRHRDAHQLSVDHSTHLMLTCLLVLMRLTHYVRFDRVFL